MSLKTGRLKQAEAALARNPLLNLRINYFKGQVRDLLRELETFPRLEEPNWHRGIDLREQVRQFEIGCIKSALKITHGNQKRAATLLQVKATTLNAKIKLYGISGYENRHPQ